MNDELKIKDNNSDLLHSLILKTHDMIFYISRAIFFIGILCAFLSIGYEVLVWIKTGEWANLRFYMLFSWLNIDAVSLVHGIGWISIRKILLWCLELPLSFGFVLVGAVFSGLISLNQATGVSHAIPKSLRSGCRFHNRRSLHQRLEGSTYSRTG